MSIQIYQWVYRLALECPIGHVPELLHDTLVQQGKDAVVPTKFELYGD